MSTSNSEIARTRTGGFPIGFRRMWFDWHKDVTAMIAWAKENQIGVIDLGSDAVETLPVLTKNGIKPGSIDLLAWQSMLSPDKKTRDEAVEKNSAHIKACAAFGPMNYFTVMLPEKPELKRSENFGYMVESYTKLAPVLEANKAKIVIEGWPGDGALCCTPEGYGAFLKQCPSPAMGINYDPSHLIRMGIDPIRFLREFANRVFHVHGKDTEVFNEALYLYGTEQPPTFGQGHGYGGINWRYTIPGQGSASWPEIFRILVAAGYKGAVSVELEDENFNAGTELEKAGILYAKNFLVGC